MRSGITDGEDRPPVRHSRQHNTDSARPIEIDDAANHRAMGQHIDRVCRTGHVESSVKPSGQAPSFHEY